MSLRPRVVGSSLHGVRGSMGTCNASWSISREEMFVPEFLLQRNEEGYLTCATSGRPVRYNVSDAAAVKGIKVSLSLFLSRKGPKTMSLCLC